MNNTQKDKYNEIYIRFEEQYSNSGECAAVGPEMINFSLYNLTEQAKEDLSFLGEILVNLQEGDIEHVKVLVNDWREELRKIIGDED